MLNTLAMIAAIVLVVGFVAAILRQAPRGLSLAQRFTIARLTGIDAGIVTLAQAQVNAANDVDYMVIDNLRRSSWLLDQIVFDDTVTPGTNGASLTYGYVRLTTAAPAGFRAFNTEFVPGQASRTPYTVNLKPLGGAFNLDRDLADLGPSASNELAFQMGQVLESVPIRFIQEMILGDTAVDALGFDGLSKGLVGSSTEITAGSVGGSADWTPATVNSQAIANNRLDEVDDWLSHLIPSRMAGQLANTASGLPDGPKAIIGNTKAITRMKALARFAGMYTQSRDDLGRQIQSYGPWTLVDIGDLYDGSGPIIPTASSGGTTDLYAVVFGIGGFHGASKANSPLVRHWLPDWSVAGAVKTGEVEMGPVAGVLKNSKACGVLRGVKVQ